MSTDALSFDEDLDAAVNAEPDFVTITVTLNDKPLRLRFEQVPGPRWAAETDLHPIRMSSLIDLKYGYNFRTMTEAIVPECGFRLDDAGERVSLTPAQWSKLFRGLNGSDVKLIGDAIFTLNETLPEDLLEAAKKASAVALGKNSSSPANSGSRTGGSTAGSRAKSRTTSTTKTAS